MKVRMLWDAAKSALLLTLLAAVTVWAGTRSATPLLDALWDAIPGETALYLALLCCGVCLGILNFLSMRRLLRALRLGVPLRRPAPYRRQKWLARGMVGLLVCWWTLKLVGGGSAIDGSSLRDGWKAYDRVGGVKPEAVYADLREMDGAWGETFFFGARTKVHELAPRMDRITQCADRPDGNQSLAESEYYRLL